MSNDTDKEIRLLRDQRNMLICWMKRHYADLGLTYYDELIKEYPYVAEWGD